MWLAGVQRGVAADARIGFHSAFRRDEDGNLVTSGGGNALAGGYLAKLGFKWSTIYYLTNADPNGIDWLNDEKAKELGIAFTMLKASNNKTEPAAAAAPGAVQWPSSNTVSLPGMPRSPVATPIVPGLLDKPTPSVAETKGDRLVDSDATNKEYQKRLVAIPPSGQCPDGSQLEPKFKRYCLLDEMTE